MKKTFFSFSGLIVVLAAFLLAKQPDSDFRTPAADTRCYEMRVYYAAPGKLDDLLAPFRNHTTGIFKKHGMTNVGYWLPMENPENKLVYVLSYPSREAREKSWKAFGADPEPDQGSDLLFGWTEAADLIVAALEAAILDKQVTYDFARLMEGANEISTSAFGRAMIERM